MKLVAVTLVAVMSALAQDEGKALFQHGVDKLQRSGSLAQQGKFAEANVLMQEGMAEMDRAVSLVPERLELRMMRGMVYGSMPPFLNKTGTAREDLEFAVGHPEFNNLAQDRRDRVLALLGRLRETGASAKPDRFPKVPAEASPLIAAASITYSDATAVRMPASIERIIKQLDGYPGLLGKHVVASLDHPGMFIIFTWWKNKQALNDWFYGDLHQGWMRQRGRVMAGDTSSTSGEIPSQVAMEVFAGLPGGVQINGGFIPSELFSARQR
jgi:heme-degrading monooxygenase HmoA